MASQRYAVSIVILGSSAHLSYTEEPRRVPLANNVRMLPVSSVRDVPGLYRFRTPYPPPMMHAIQNKGFREIAFHKDTILKEPSLVEQTRHASKNLRQKRKAGASSRSPSRVFSKTDCTKEIRRI